jgi:hypothetical protein
MRLILSAVLRKSNNATLYRHLNRPSTGQLIVARLEPTRHTWNVSSKEWNKECRNMEIHISGQDTLFSVHHVDNKADEDDVSEDLQVYSDRFGLSIGDHNVD